MAPRCKKIIENPGCNQMLDFESDCGLTISISDWHYLQVIPPGTDLFVKLDKCNYTMPSPNCNDTIVVPPCYICNMTINTPKCNFTLENAGCVQTKIISKCDMLLEIPPCQGLPFIPAGHNMILRSQKCNQTIQAPACNGTTVVANCFICNMTLVTPNCTLTFENPGCNQIVVFDCGVKVITPACTGQYVPPSWNITVDIGYCNFR